MTPTLPRLSSNMACRCAKPDEIIDPDAPTGTIHDCPTCTMSYINDDGVWRSTLSLERRKIDKLMAIGRVELELGRRGLS